MRIWLLGGAGVVLSHLCAKLVHLPNTSIFVVDNEIIGKLSYLDKLPVAAMWKDDLATCTLDFREGDVIYFGAAQSNFQSETDREGAYKNVHSTVQNVMKQCLHKDVRFIFLSSRCVYGHTEGLVREASTLNPNTYYGKLKVWGEYCVRALKNHAIVRLSNVYGEYRPYWQYMGVADKFMAWALNGEPLQVEGGKQTFDFTFIDDVVGGLIKILSLPMHNFTVHFTSGRCIDIASLAYLIKGITGSQSEVKFKEPRSWEVEPPWFIGDVSLARDQLGLTFPTTLYEGLVKMKERYRFHSACELVSQSNYAKYLRLFGEGTV